MKIIYKIIYPKGKIYIGKDLTNNINYFCSANETLVARVFSQDERMRFTITREILWWSETADDREVARREVAFIRQLRSNESSIGYNRWPRLL